MISLYLYIKGRLKKECPKRLLMQWRDKKKKKILDKYYYICSCETLSSNLFVFFYKISLKLFLVIIIFYSNILNCFIINVTI